MEIVIVVGYNHKDMRKYTNIFLFLVCIAAVIMAGCTSPFSAPSATPTPQTVYVTVLVTPTPTTTDPILGTWRSYVNNNGDVGDIRIKFNSDHSLINNAFFTGLVPSTLTGTWEAVGNNQYKITWSDGSADANYWVLDQSGNYFIIKGVRFDRYSGDVNIVSNSKTLAPAKTIAKSSEGTGPVTLSGTGSNVHTVTIPISGTYLISASAIPSGASYGDFSVYITDTTTGKGPGGIGGGLTFNEFVEPSYSGTKSVRLTAGKYLISVEGHCTYTLKISAI